MYFNECKFNADKEEFALFVKVSEYCNLRCSFCYQNSPEGDILKPENYQTCFDNIDYYVAGVKKIRDSGQSKYAILNIVMFGGEPTMNPAGIKAICEHINLKYGDDPDYDFLYVSMTTNGVVYNPEIGKYLRKALNKTVSILISCDFDKIKADENRKIKGFETKSAYDTIMSNIKLYEADPNYHYIKIGSVVADSKQSTLQNYFETMQTETLKIKGKIKKGFKQLNMHQLYDLQDEKSEYDDYLKKYTDQFYKVGSEIIMNLNKKNFVYSMDLIQDQYLTEGFQQFSECFCMTAIDCKGNFNFCNSHKATPDGNTDPEAVKAIILNPEYGEGSYPCSQRQQNYGARYKTKVMKELQALMDSRLQRVPLISLVVDPIKLTKLQITKINKWIEYSELGTIPNSTEKYKIRINSEFKPFVSLNNLEKVEFINEIDPTAFYIDSKGDIYASVLLPLKLNSLNHETSVFMYIFNEDLNTKNEFIKNMFDELKTK